MQRASGCFRPGDRQAISARLRALAAFVALLLGTSSLGQVAHFVLVPHAVCLEHGELVELHGAAEAHADAAGAANQERVTAPHGGDEHDHCELIARAEREQLLGPAPSLDVAAAARSVERCGVAREQLERPALGVLMLAPKTSPPASRA